MYLIHQQPTAFNPIYNSSLLHCHTTSTTPRTTFPTTAQTTHSICALPPSSLPLLLSSPVSRPVAPVTVPTPTSPTSVYGAQPPAPEPKTTASGPSSSPTPISAQACAPLIPMALPFTVSDWATLTRDTSSTSTLMSTARKAKLRPRSRAAPAPSPSGSLLLCDEGFDLSIMKTS